VTVKELPEISSIQPDREQQRIDTDGWGKGTVTALADCIRPRYPGTRGSSQQNLWKIRQFFEPHRDTPELSSLLKELPRSSNLHILTKTSRSLSPVLVAEYQTRLPDKKLLQAKLHEFYALSEPEAP
jgi:hypothetical protein